MDCKFWLRSIILLQVVKMNFGCRRLFNPENGWKGNGYDCKINEAKTVLDCTRIDNIPQLLEEKPKFTDIKEISVKGLNSSKLLPGSFEGLSMLIVINLRGNVLESLHRDVFVPVPKLTNLDLSSNKLTSLESMLFSSLNNLTFLDLSNNFFQFLLDPQLFKSQESLSTLRLSKNRLVSIDVSVMVPMKSLRMLQLDGNEFICNCGLHLFIKWCKENNVATNNSCESPEEYKGKLLLKVIPSDVCGIATTTPSPPVTTTSVRSTVPDYTKEFTKIAPAGFSSNGVVDKSNKTSNTSSNSSSTVVILAACVGVLVIAICMLLAVYFWKKNKPSRVTMLDNSVKFNKFVEEYCYEDYVLSPVQNRISVPPVLPERPLTLKNGAGCGKQTVDESISYDYVGNDITEIAKSGNSEHHDTSNYYSESKDISPGLSKRNSLYLSE